MPGKLEEVRKQREIEKAVKRRDSRIMTDTNKKKNERQDSDSLLHHRPAPQLHGLWIDVRLGDKIMKRLWDHINSGKEREETRANSKLAGNISNSWFIEDKDDWFMKNVLKECCEYMYFKDSWYNYYNVHVAQAVNPPVFELDEYWVNYQYQTEFNPPHMHSGVFSFVIFMKIPTHWKDQHAIPISGNSNSPMASDFQFFPPPTQGLPHQARPKEANFALSPSDEGRMLLFPSWLTHQVFPFYNCEEERITVSGNIFFKREEHKTNTFKENEKWQNTNY